MLIRMSHWVTKPGMDEESRRLWEERVRAIWRAQPGLIQAHLLAEDGSDRRMTFSVWRTQADYDAFRASDALREVAAAYDAIYTEDGRPAPVDWRVLTDDWPDTGR
jgi:heme-degrading monooxygenase HmoA